MNCFDKFGSILNRRADAVAYVNGSRKYKNVNGKVMFYFFPCGVVVRTEISGLPKGSKPCNYPIFAFHIHGGEKCSGNEKDLFANAGTHYNPYNCPHPEHSGDLPPLFGVNGNAFSVFLTDRFNVTEVIGKTVIIHASPDDFTTQPSGNAGVKIACGVITSASR